MFQLCLGIPWGAPVKRNDDLHGVATARRVCLAGFGIGRWQMPMAAQAMILGGHVRVGLEDNLYLDKGVYASNGSLTRARNGDYPVAGRQVAIRLKAAPYWVLIMTAVKTLGIAGSGVIGAGWGRLVPWRTGLMSSP